MAEGRRTMPGTGRQLRISQDLVAILEQVKEDRDMRSLSAALRLVFVDSDIAGAALKKVRLRVGRARAAALRLARGEDLAAVSVLRSVSMVKDEKPGVAATRMMRVSDEVLAQLYDIQRSIGAVSKSETIRRLIADSELAKRAIEHAERARKEGLDG